MFLLGSAEAHHVPQRAAHYTGDSLPVNTFLKFFSNSLKRPSGGALRMAPGGRKEPFFPGKYAVFAESALLVPCCPTSVQLCLYRGSGGAS